MEKCRVTVTIAFANIIPIRTDISCCRLTRLIPSLLKVSPATKVNLARPLSIPVIFVLFIVISSCSSWSRARSFVVGRAKVDAMRRDRARARQRGKKETERKKSSRKREKTVGKEVEKDRVTGRLTEGSIVIATEPSHGHDDSQCRCPLSSPALCTAPSFRACTDILVPVLRTKAKKVEDSSARSVWERKVAARIITSGHVSFAFVIHRGMGQYVHTET